MSEPNLEAITKLSRDLRAAAATLGVREARYFVSTYYDMQDYRIAAGNQQRKLLEGAEPSEFMQWFSAQLRYARAPDSSCTRQVECGAADGRGARAITGIGPVISSGLIAHIDIAKAPTAGHIWRYAGLDPTVKWAKGEKRPWNAQLKRLCWSLGESFVKVSGRDNDVYGHFTGTAGLRADTQRFGRTGGTRRGAVEARQAAESRSGSDRGVRGRQAAGGGIARQGEAVGSKDLPQSLARRSLSAALRNEAAGAVPDCVSRPRTPHRTATQHAAA